MFEFLARAAGAPLVSAYMTPCRRFLRNSQALSQNIREARESRLGAIGAPKPMLSVKPEYGFERLAVESAGRFDGKESRRLWWSKPDASSLHYRGNDKSECPRT